MEITLGKKNLCPCDTFEIFVNFENLAIFEISNGNFSLMAINIAIFFVIFDEDDALFILVVSE